MILLNIRDILYLCGILLRVATAAFMHKNRRDGIMENLRLKKFRERMSARKLDCALIYSDANRNYLSGFTGNESYSVITADSAVFVTDSRFTEQAQSQVRGFEVRQYDSKIGDFLIDLVKSLHVKNLGIEEDHMTYKMYTTLKAGLNDVEFVPLDGMTEKLRQVKEPSELENIGKAAGIADKAFLHMLEYIKPEMTENEVGLELEFFMRRLGASGLSFPSIVASGKRSSLPHGAPSDKVIERGDFLTLDFGCVYNGYCSDMTRTVVVGSASERQKEIYDIVLNANLKVLEKVKPGMSGREIDSIARDFIGAKGYGANFGHGLGHGVGVEIHELPMVSKRGETRMEPGMVITDEPGIYIPDFGGVRIEDLLTVTEDGCRLLSHSDKSLIEL